MIKMLRSKAFWDGFFRQWAGMFDIFDPPSTTIIVNGRKVDFSTPKNEREAAARDLDAMARDWDAIEGDWDRAAKRMGMERSFPMKETGDHLRTQAAEVKGTEMNAAYQIDYTEYERGWGSKPDGASLHPTKESADAHIVAHWAKYPDRKFGDAPDYYIAPGTPRLVEITEAQATALAASESGMIWL